MKKHQIIVCCGALIFGLGLGAVASANPGEDLNETLSRRLFVHMQDGDGVECGEGLACRGPAEHAGASALEGLRAQGATIVNCYGLPNGALREIMGRAEKFSGNKTPDLTQCFEVTLPERLDRDAIVSKLALVPGVKTAYPSPPILPRPQMMTDTPDFSSGQWYLGSSDNDGLQFEAFWAEYGVFGEGIRAADIEVDFNTQHEDLPTARAAKDWEGVGSTVRQGQTYEYIQHGTSAFGMVLAEHNGYGMDGMAPGVIPFFASELTREYPWGLGSALLRLLQHFEAGDVVLLEAQTSGPRYDTDNGESQFGLIPVEWLQVNYDAIRTASNLGVIVVEAAGNGEQNLDDEIYGGVFDRDVRDSGAIVVCASNPPVGDYGPTRGAIFFTNRGSRCDVQSYGAELYAPGYGDLYDGGNDDRYYTAQFGGTSGASPIVTGAVALLQSLARSRETLLLPAGARALLRDTGIAQAPGDTIGPMPDMMAAAEALNEYTSLEAPPLPEDPGLWQRCDEDACAAGLDCVEVTDGESYCLDLCEPFVEDGGCEEGSFCAFQADGTGMCETDEGGDGAIGDRCDDGTRCAANHFCGGDGLCYAFCSLSRQEGCPENGTCFSFGEGGDRGYCFIDESNPDGEEDGGACEVNTDCQGGWCVTEWPEGYCVDLLCREDADCNGESSVCVRVDLQTRYCMQSCVRDHECREGYACQDDLCQPGEKAPCANNLDCAEGFMCDAGECVEPQEPDNNGAGPDNNGAGPDNNGAGPDNNGAGPDNNGAGPDNNGAGPDNNGAGANNNGAEPGNNGSGSSSGGSSSGESCAVGSVGGQVPGFGGIALLLGLGLIGWRRRAKI